MQQLHTTILGSFDFVCSLVFPSIIHVLVLADVTGGSHTTRDGFGIDADRSSFGGLVKGSQHLPSGLLSQQRWLIRSTMHLSIPSLICSLVHFLHV